MHPRRIFPRVAPPLLLLLLSGCGYIHVGRMPSAAPVTTIMGDEQLLRENSGLKLEKKILQQELAITRAQGDALRMAIENRAADGDTSRRLTEKLNETSRDLAVLRANYGKLQLERDTAVTNASESAGLRARLGATEEKLASSMRTFTELQEEIGRLKSEVERTRTENVALGEQVKTVTAQNAEALAALAQLNTQLLTQKDARSRAEQDAETLRTQLQSVAPNASALAQQRTGAAAEARSLAAEHAAEIAALKQELDGSRTQLATLETERTQLKAQLGNAPAPALAHVEAKLNTALKSNSELRDELSATKAQLEAQLVRLKDTSAPNQVATLRDELRGAQAQAAALTEENARLKGRVASGRPEAPVRIELTPSEPRVAAAAPPTAEPQGSASPTAAGAKPGAGVNAMLVTSAPGSQKAAVVPRVDLAGQARVHVVGGGDTLSKISNLYYGTPTRWSEILAANRDILGESNNLVIGRTLRIP